MAGSDRHLLGRVDKLIDLACLQTVTPVLGSPVCASVAGSDPTEVTPWGVFNPVTGEICPRGYLLTGTLEEVTGVTLLDSGDCEAAVAVPEVLRQALELDKEGSYNLATGDIDYTFTIRNRSDALVTGILLTDTHIGLNDLPVPDIPPLGVEIITWSYTPTPGELLAGGVENDAHIIGTYTGTGEYE